MTVAIESEELEREMELETIGDMLSGEPDDPLREVGDEGTSLR
jgi:hypothetical protein